MQLQLDVLSIPFTPGDCLFDSLSFGLCQSNIERSATDLRAKVARAAQRSRAASTLEFWRDVLENGDEETRHEYRFAAPLSESGLPRDVAMRELFDNMMDPVLYWGDEFALQTLASLFHTRFLIVKPTTSSCGTCRTQMDRPERRRCSQCRKSTTQTFSASAVEPEQRAPSTLMVLYLTGGHYQPASVDGRFIFPIS